MTNENRLRLSTEAVKSAAEGDTETINRPEKEKLNPESNPEELVHELQQRSERITQESQRIFELENIMALEGGRELVAIYGAERFFAALDATRSNQSEDVSTKSLHTVIKKIEPDTAKRATLYADIQQRSEQGVRTAEEKIRQANTTEKEQELHALVDHSFGYDRNNAQILTNKLDQYRLQDKLESSELSKKLIGRLEAILNGKPELLAPSSEIYYGDGSNVEDRLRQQLVNPETDPTIILYGERGQLDLQKKELQSEALKVAEQLEGSVRAIENEIEIRLANQVQKLVADAEGLKNFTSESETASEMLESVVLQLEEAVVQMRAQAQAEIAQKTAPLRQMIATCKAL